MKLLLKSGLLWDSVGSWRKGDLLLEHGHICGEGSFSAADADKTIDLSGWTVLPGFLDAHVHIQLDDGPFDDEVLTAWARNGVAAVRDCAMLSARQVPEFMAWQEDHTSADWPLVVNTGKYIDVPGGYGSELPPGHPIGLLAETPEQAAGCVDYLWKNGCTQIKIALDDSPSPFSPEPRQHNLTPELIRSICSQAAQHGMRVTAHVLSARHLQTLIDCGISDAGHTPTDPIPDELLEEMVRLGIPMVTTAVGPVEDHRPELKPKRPGPPPPPPEIAAQLEHRRQVAARGALDNLKRFRDAGGTVLLGTDLMFSNCYDTCACIPVREMAALRAEGFSVEDVLRAGTIAPAHAMGLSDRIGTLEAGKDASIVAVKGSLDDSFEKLHCPDLVINRGAVLTERNITWITA